MLHNHVELGDGRVWKCHSEQLCVHTVSVEVSDIFTPSFVLPTLSPVPPSTSVSVDESTSQDSFT